MYLWAWAAFPFLPLSEITTHRMAKKPCRLHVSAAPFSGIQPFSFWEESFRFPEKTVSPSEMVLVVQ